MLLTITTTHNPATDLGYLLHKHPARVQTFNLSFGQAHVYYTEATEDRCTANLLLDIDPVGLVRGKQSFSLAQYVNDRPYVASSFLSVAIAQVYGTALNGNSRDRPQLAASSIPLTAHLTSVPTPELETLNRLFEPLGYAVEVETMPLDPHYPQWGEAGTVNLTLHGEVRLSDLLSHLYVLIPALDVGHHFYVGEGEIEKLLTKGEGWLPDHPERNFITRRYLGYRRSLTGVAIRRLAEHATVTEEAGDERQDAEEKAIEKPLSLHQQRIEAVLNILLEAGASRVLDLGCGEGKLLHELARRRQFTEIVGVDVSAWALERAEKQLDRLPPLVRDRIILLQGALTYRDTRLTGYDAAVLMEVIEHIDEPRLDALEQAVFGVAQPGVVIITTPNADYNVTWESLSAGAMRHRDHRFEWSRTAFRERAGRAAETFGYAVEFAPIGPVNEELGSPTQMAVFTREESKRDRK